MDYGWLLHFILYFAQFSSINIADLLLTSKGKKLSKWIIEIYWEKIFNTIWVNEIYYKDIASHRRRVNKSISLLISKMSMVGLCPVLGFTILGWELIWKWKLKPVSHHKQFMNEVSTRISACVSTMQSE